MTKKKKIIVWAASVIAMLAAAILAFVLIFDVANWQRLDPKRLHALAQTSSLYDRNGELISELRGTENRTVISLSEVPIRTQQAFLAAEDLRFYKHPGIDVTRIAGALVSNLRTGGFGQQVTQFLTDTGQPIKVLQIAIPDQFVEQGSVGRLREETGLDAASIVKRIIVEYIGM